MNGVDPLVMNDVRGVALGMVNHAALHGAAASIGICSKHYPNGDRVFFLEWRGDPMVVAELFQAAAETLAHSLNRGPQPPAS